MEEQSSDGDVSTVDVIYPASPQLMYLTPQLIHTLLLPIMAYANNCTQRLASFSHESTMTSHFRLIKTDSEQSLPKKS